MKKIMKIKYEIKDTILCDKWAMLGKNLTKFFVKFKTMM